MSTDLTTMSAEAEPTAPAPKWTAAINDNRATTQLRSDGARLVLTVRAHNLGDVALTGRKLAWSEYNRRLADLDQLPEVKRVAALRATRAVAAAQMPADLELLTNSRRDAVAAGDLDTAGKIEGKLTSARAKAALIRERLELLDAELAEAIDAARPALQSAVRAAGTAVHEHFAAGRVAALDAICAAAGEHLTQFAMSDTALRSLTFMTSNMSDEVARRLLGVPTLVVTTTARSDRPAALAATA